MLLVFVSESYGHDRLVVQPGLEQHSIPLQRLKYAKSHCSTLLELRFRGFSVVCRFEVQSQANVQAAEAQVGFHETTNYSYW